MKHLWGFVLFFLCGVFTSQSESFNPVQWKIAWDSVGENEVEIFFTAKIEKGWHIYGMNLPQGGPVSTDFTFHTLKNIKQEKTVFPLSSPIIFYDSIFGMEISTFSNKVSFSALFERTSKEDFLLEGEIIYMACDGQHCLAPQREKYNMISVHREYDLHERG
ncbi:MAG TPA: hypothetical protein DDY68_06270 [Porphyromonadaceae bacterium]|nr:hypothetical protein [Porphyromonadaceae bacterium]